MGDRFDKGIFIAKIKSLYSVAQSISVADGISRISRLPLNSTLCSCVQQPSGRKAEAMDW